MTKYQNSSQELKESQSSSDWQHSHIQQLRKKNKDNNVHKKRIVKRIIKSQVKKQFQSNSNRINQKDKPNRKVISKKQLIDQANLKIKQIEKQYKIKRINIIKQCQEKITHFRRTYQQCQELIQNYKGQYCIDSYGKRLNQFSKEMKYKQAEMNKILIDMIQDKFCKTLSATCLMKIQKQIKDKVKQFKIAWDQYEQIFQIFTFENNDAQKTIQIKYINQQLKQFNIILNQNQSNYKEQYKKNKKKYYIHRNPEMLRKLINGTYFQQTNQQSTKCFGHIVGKILNNQWINKIAKEYKMGQKEKHSVQSCDQYVQKQIYIKKKFLHSYLSKLLQEHIRKGHYPKQVRFSNESKMKNQILQNLIKGAHRQQNCEDEIFDVLYDTLESKNQ